MFDALVNGLIILLDPLRMAMLLVGVAVGARPGRGALPAMALALPFLLGGDPYGGIAMLAGIAAAAQGMTAQGTTAQGTMAQDTTPLGALLGGLAGAAAVFALVPLARPWVLGLGAAELLVLTLPGLCLAAALGRGRPFAGVSVAAAGLALGALVGAPAGGREGALGWGGMAPAILALGLFVVPQGIGWLRQGGAMAATPVGPGGGAAGMLGGAALLPTLLVGIPASGATALLLAGLAGFGWQAGPALLRDNLELVFMVAWALMLGHGGGAVLRLGLARPLGWLAALPARGGAGLLLGVALLGAGAAGWAGLAALAGCGALGWAMCRLGLPRLPLLAGFVLGPLAAGYLRVAHDLYGWEWLLRPGVLAIALTALGLCGAMAWRRGRP